MKTKEELKITGGNLIAVRVGLHKDSKPYIDFELNGKVIGMPSNSELRKLRNMINYVVRKHIARRLNLKGRGNENTDR